VTVVCFGGIGLELEKSAALLLQDELYLDIFYPLHVSGCSIQPIIDSVQETGRLLFVEEGTEVATLSAEYLRRFITGWRRANLPKMKFVAAKECPIPAASDLEKQVLPGADEIYAALLDLYDE
jgi:pyruvate/2-oxoglutarate/acetoin dehydrogenase E1 component